LYGCTTLFWCRWWFAYVRACDLWRRCVSACAISIETGWA
jgi:hypothetical protein